MEYLLKARTVEPKKQPLQANGSETTFVCRQWLGKHVSAATETHTVENGVLYLVRAKRLYGRQLGQPSQFGMGGCEEKGQLEGSRRSE
jgi:hypothetical protein